MAGRSGAGRRAVFSGAKVNRPPGLELRLPTTNAVRARDGVPRQSFEQTEGMNTLRTKLHWLARATGTVHLPLKVGNFGCQDKRCC